MYLKALHSGKNVNHSVPSSNSWIFKPSCKKDVSHSCLSVTPQKVFHLWGGRGVPGLQNSGRDRIPARKRQKGHRISCCSPNQQTTRVISSGISLAPLQFGEYPCRWQMMACKLCQDVANSFYCFNNTIIGFHFCLTVDLANGV